MHVLRFARIPARSPASVAGRVAALLAGLLVVAGCSTVAPSGSPAPIVTTTQAQPPITPAPDAPAPAAAPNPAPAVPTAVAKTSEPADPLASLPAPTGRPPAPPDATPDLWARIRAGFAMPPLNSRLVADKERFYLQRPDYLQRMFSRGSRYLFHIVEELEKRGMPTELALLPFVESAMNPVALSHAQAAGLWQFIPSTGRAYNLRQDWWVDNRRDVVKSTEAALDYLQKIYAMHGNDWFLALASYNWGEGAVARAVRRNQARGRPADYLSLPMPAETRHYVPKLMALKNIVLRADELGVALPQLPNRPYFVTIEKTRPIDLKLAAGFAGMSVDEFVALNPAHNRPVIAASRNNEIKLPADRLDAFLAAVEQHGQANRAFATWQPHTLKTGETLESIAQRGGVAVAELREANDLRAGQRILPGTRILAPQGAIDDETRVERFDAPRVYELVERPAKYHKVRPRETLAQIARRYGTTIANLKVWNGIAKAAQAGTNLLVRPASAQTMLTTENGDRRVLRSESDEPRVMRAVLRREATEPPPRGDDAAERTRSDRPAAKRADASKRKASAPASKTTAKKSRTAGRAGAIKTGPAKRPAGKPNKRT
ncbi:MAG TPA: transglycosylase SLT domain-containing protein [Zeimonas sp.]|nr:transglycosylase SLT domain-containing protein [Zeimonas sp.]